MQACVIYHHILMYMGDIPGRRSRLGMELTDVIFDGPLKHVSKQINTLCFHSIHEYLSIRIKCSYYEKCILYKVQI